MTWAWGEAVVVFGTAAVATALLTPVVRRYLVWRQLLDHPSARRSHQTPTPRGGGLALMVVYGSGIVTLYTAGLLDSALYYALLGAGAVVSLVSVVDDHRPVAQHWRLAAHIVAAAWLLYCLGIPQSIAFPGGGVVYALFWGLGLVWLINLYNFMDGIDGLAAGETLCVAVLAVGLLGVGTLSGLLLLIAGGCAGFLLWNRPPARIFMGDSGSCLLGLLWGAVILEGSQHDAMPVWVWLILLGVFWVDASWTLLWRLFTGQRWWQAHRQHAYQHAAQRYGHGTVTIGAMLVTLVWLGPWAYWAIRQPQWGILAWVFAWAPLILLAIIFRAGRAQTPTGAAE